MRAAADERPATARLLCEAGADKDKADETSAGASACVFAEKSGVS